MKREFLESIEVNGTKLPAEIVDSIIEEHGKDIENTKKALAAKSQELEALTTERDGLKNQISERDKDIKELRKQAGNSEELNNKLTELQTKYDTDTAALQQRIEDQTLNHATEKFFSQFEFASELAKKAAIADFKEQKFKFDEKTGDFQGGKDWIDNLRQSDPAAFKVTETNNNNGGGNGYPDNRNLNLPYFVASTGNNTSGNSAANGGNSNFDFGFSGVREHKK